MILLVLFLLFGLQAGVVDVPIFSFYMGNVDTDSPTGVLTLGGVNQTHYEGGRRFQLALGLWEATKYYFILQLHDRTDKTPRLTATSCCIYS